MYRNKIAILLNFVFLMSSLMIATAAEPKILPEPLPAHPRLLATPEDWSRLKTLVDSDPAAARIFTALRHAGDAYLEQPTLERVMTGRRLLHVSREALERITILALLANVTDEKKYADRAIAEVKKVAEFSDWNPSHYLDVAEMSLAVAVGYDWLYSYLSDEEREFIGKTLIEKGIKPSLTEPEPGWVRGRNNWNQVCNAGLSAAAIATADLDPKLAEQILQRSIAGLPSVAHSYAPDGAYVEAAMYWNYGTSFHVVLAAMLERLTGSTQDIEKYPGFAASADYVNQMTTPSGKFWCYSDCRPERQLLIPLFWFAKKFNRPDLVAQDLKHLDAYLNAFEKGDFDDSNYRLLALALLWYRPVDAKSEVPATRSAYFRGEMPVVVFRSEKIPGFFAGIKGGSPSLSHAHMDEGSFFIESDGVIWAEDFGLQDYYSLESVNVNMWAGAQEGQRWKTFRFGPDAHNILRFDGKLQLITGRAEFDKVQLEGDEPFGVLDLSSLYQGQAEKVRRGMKMINGQTMLLQDEWQISGESAQEATFQWLTTADVSVNANSVGFHLSKADKGLNVMLCDPIEAKIEVQPVADLLQWFDAPIPEAKRIVIRVPKAGGKGLIRLLISFDSCLTVAPTELKKAVPLEAW